MRTFKQFLLEASVGPSIKYNHLSEEETAAMLKKYCPSALTYGARFWRGVYDDVYDVGHTSWIDLSLTTRASENTSNHYTLILDNHPKMKKFPKRSKSLIFTSSKAEAEDYGNLYAVFPYDTNILGVCPQNDIWKTQCQLPCTEVTLSIEVMNGYWQDFFHYVNVLSRTLSFASFEEADKKLKDGDNMYLDALDHFMKNIKYHFKLDEKTASKISECFRSDFLKTAFSMYDPSITGLKTIKATAEIDSKTHEYWCSGKVILIDLDYVDTILEMARK